MLLSPVYHQRIKHFDILLAKELSIIEREHFYNLVSHQKLENSIRSNSRKSSTNDREKVSIPFDDIYNQRTGTIDFHRYQIIKPNTSRQSSSRSVASSHISRAPSSQIVNQPKEDSMTNPNINRLPPIIKASINVRQRRDVKNVHWMTTMQQIHQKKSNKPEVFTIINDGPTNTGENSKKLIEQQVRTFLNTLPNYQGVQQGFDNFAPSSFSSRKKSSIIR